MKRSWRIALISSLILLCAKMLSAEYLPRILPVTRPNNPEFTYADAKTWAYLRKGLTYLESPQPLGFPEAVPPTYVHPDGRGFGAYGLSPGAYEDVQRTYVFFRDYTWEEILGSARLYDLANQAFADLLLAHLQEFIPAGADNQTVFMVLHQAWNLGLSGFKQGRQVVSSRTRRALEFLQMPMSAS